MRARRFILIGLLFFSLAGAVFLGQAIFFYLLYFWLILLVLAAVWAWTSLGRVRLVRQTRALRARVGAVFEERLLVRNQGRTPKLWLEVRDLSTLPDHQASQVVIGLGGGQESGWGARTLCRQRGRFQLGPVKLTSGDPFGLFEASRVIPQTNPLVVYPATFDLVSLNVPTGALPGGDAVRRRTHYVTPNASSVRDYAPGDALSRIHWRSTARRDRLMVKEFELDPQSDVWILLDGDRNAQVAATETPAYDWDGRALKPGEALRLLAPNTEEYLVSIAASLAQHFVRRDRAVGFVAYGQTREVFQPDYGERQMTRLLETLAVFQASGTVRLNEALMLEGDTLPRGSTLIVVTAAWDVRWVAYAHALHRRGLQVMAVLVNPASFGGGKSNAGVAESLGHVNIPAYLVNQGDDLSAVFARRAN